MRLQARVVEGTVLVVAEVSVDPGFPLCRRDARRRSVPTPLPNPKVTSITVMDPITGVRT